MTPLVSVVMSVHNGGKYLREAVDSILNQTFRDFEFIIIDDGSTDGSDRLLDECALKDLRIRIIHQENRGLTNSLNTGLGLVRGRFVARMDADDVSEATRLARQVEFLEAQLDHVAVGASGQIIDERGHIVGRMALGGDDRDLAVRFLGGNFMIHGSVMFRSGHGLQYNGALRYSQDYDFWVRLRGYGKIANLSEPLYRWRQHPGGISATKAIEQRQIARRVADDHLQKLLQQGKHDVVLEACTRSIGGAARAAELRKALTTVKPPSAEVRLRCARVLASMGCSGRRAVADFPFWVGLFGTWNASWMLSRVLCRQAGRRLFGRRLDANAAAAAKSELSTN